MTTCCDQRSASFWPRARARMSLGPPGVKPTTKRTGFCGNAWQNALPAKTNKAKPRKIGVRHRLLMLLHERAVHAGAHQLAVVVALAGALRHPDDGEVFLRVDPEVGAAEAAPVRVADGAGRGSFAAFGAHRESQAEAVAGSGNVGRAA